MRELLKNRSDYFSHSNLLDEIEDSDELFDRLEEITYYIGHVIMEFNALESTIEYLIAEQMMRSGDQDDRIYVFLSEMMFQRKASPNKSGRPLASRCQGPIKSSPSK